MSEQPCHWPKPIKTPYTPSQGLQAALSESALGSLLVEDALGTQQHYLCRHHGLSDLAKPCHLLYGVVQVQAAGEGCQVCGRQPALLQLRKQLPAWQQCMSAFAPVAKGGARADDA